jgi:hypothetical protein
VISRRTILLSALWALAIAVPTSYSRGRAFEGRKLQPESYVQERNVLNSVPIVFVRTLVGGEPEILRVIASAGLLLTGACAISLGFNFAPKKKIIETTVSEKVKQESGEIAPIEATEQLVIVTEDASDEIRNE